MKAEDEEEVANWSKWMSERKADRSTCRLQLPGQLRDLFGEHVLGTMSFLYSIDPGRVNLGDAALEISTSSLRNAALVCSAWHGCAAATFEWERQRHADEKRLLLDPYVHPFTCGVHLAPCSRAAVYDSLETTEEGESWLDPPRFVRLPFKEGDVLILDASRLARACDGLREESPSSVPLQRMSCEARVVERAMEKSALRRRGGGRRRRRQRQPPSRFFEEEEEEYPPRLRRRQSQGSSQRDGVLRVVSPGEEDDYSTSLYRSASEDEPLLLRCRISRLSAIALPRRKSANEWWKARGPGGRVVIEVGVESRRADAGDDDEDEADVEPLFEIADARDLDSANTTEDLRPAIDEARSCFKTLSLSKNPLDSSNTIAYSLPLPLLEPGVVVKVVPACYRSPCLDWPCFKNQPVPLGSAFCNIRERPQLLLGYARELRSSRRAALPPDDFVDQQHTNTNSQLVNDPESQSRIRHVLYVRDAADGKSASGEAAFWGLSAWTRGDLRVYDTPRGGGNGGAPSCFVPPSLAHLVLDCASVFFEERKKTTRARLEPNVGNREDFSAPLCAVCSAPLATISSRNKKNRLPPCGCDIYCSASHMRAHCNEHHRWCQKKTIRKRTASVDADNDDDNICQEVDFTP